MQLFRSALLTMLAAVLIGGSALASTDYFGSVSAWNAELESVELSPSAGLPEGDIDPAIVSLSDEIVGSETDPQSQVRLIYQWVTSQIYYDMDAFLSDGETFHEPLDVIEHRRAMCDGFAGLFQVLVQARGIPVILCQGYALGQGTSGTWTEENYMLHEINHNWNEVYLDGEWVLMDPTWDVNNAYTAGLFFDGEAFDQWYGFSAEQLDATRRVDVRGTLSYEQLDAGEPSPSAPAPVWLELLASFAAPAAAATGGMALLLLTIRALSIPLP